MKERTKALAAAASPSWEDRVEAARSLAPLLDPETEPVLLRLLLDAQDTGVTKMAADALLDRRDLIGMALVLRAMASGDFEQQEELLWSISDAWKTRGVPVPDLLTEALSVEDEQVRNAAREVQDRLPR